MICYAPISYLFLNGTDVSIDHSLKPLKSRALLCRFYPYVSAIHLFLTLAVKRIMKGITDNVSELINEENNFCLPISNRSR